MESYDLSKPIRHGQGQARSSTLDQMITAIDEKHEDILF